MPTETPVWSDVAQAYLAHLRDNRDVLQEHENTPNLFRLIEHSGCDPSQILDMGCADGRFTSKISLKYTHCDVYAYDIAQVMIEQALKDRQSERITYFIHDINDLKFPFIYGLGNASCSHVICKMVFPSLEDICPAIKSARRFLKDGGRFIVSTLDESYVRKYTIPKFQKWYAGLRYFLEDEVARKELGIEDDQEAIAFYAFSMHELRERPNAIWTTIADSRFMIPIYLHPNDYIKEKMKQAGFRLFASEHIYITQEFADQYVQYKNRVRMNVLWNTVWEKLPLDERIESLYYEEDYAI